MKILLAIQIRGSIVRDLDFGGNGEILCQYPVSEKGGCGHPARHLNNVRLNDELE
jgi:hypothetical protein